MRPVALAMALLTAACSPELPEQVVGTHPDAGGEVTNAPLWPPDEPLPAAFDMPPWLTMPAPGRLVVSWATPGESTGTVHFGTTPHLGTILATPAPTRLHHVDLGLLLPATAYYYEVRVDGTAARRRGVFVTPGLDQWRFMAVGEFHAATRAGNAASFSQVICEFRPHLLVESGDMVNSGDSATDWRAYLRASSAWISNVIILPAHSNHVNGFGGNAMVRLLFELPGNERWYATRYGQVEFLTIDSTYGSNPDIGTTQVDWLAARAAEAHDGIDDPARLVAAWHYPACSSHYPSRATSRDWVRTNLVDTLVAAGGVDLILVGHDKYYERSLIDGTITQVMTNIGLLSPGTAGETDPRCTPVATDTATLSLALFEVSGTTLSGRVVDPAGTVLDTFTLE